MEFGENQEEPRNDANVRNGQEARGTAGIPGVDDDRKLFVGGLSHLTTERELKEYFTTFGHVESVAVKIDVQTGKPRGFGFIVFSNPSTIDKLLTSGEHYINMKKVDPKRVVTEIHQLKVKQETIQDSELRDYFSKYGTIDEIPNPFDKVENQRNGCSCTEAKAVGFELHKQPKQYFAGKEVGLHVCNEMVIPAFSTTMPGVGRGYVLTRGADCAAPPTFPPTPAPYRPRPMMQGRGNVQTREVEWPALLQIPAYGSTMQGVGQGRHNVQTREGGWSALLQIPAFSTTMQGVGPGRGYVVPTFPPPPPPYRPSPTMQGRGNVQTREVEWPALLQIPAYGSTMQGIATGRGNVLTRGVGWAAPPPFPAYINSFGGGYGGGDDPPSTSHDTGVYEYRYVGPAQGAFGAGAKPREGSPFKRPLPY